MELTLVGYQSALAMLLLEGLKQLVYKLIPNFKLDPKWYVLILPILSLGVLPFASWLAGGALDWTLWTSDVIRQTIITLISALLSSLEYNTTLRPFKDAVQKYNRLQK